MTEELARQIENDIKITSVVKLPDRVLRDVELGDRCVCDCRDCNTCDVLHHVRDAAQVVCGVDYGTCTSVGACRSPITSTARRRANLQHRNLRLGRSLHCSCTSKHVKSHKLQTRHLKIHLKVRNIAKQITKKYLQKIKRFISTKTKSRKSGFKTNRKINQLAFLKENDPRRRKKYYVGKTAPGLGLPFANSVNVLKTSTVFRSVSSISTTIRMAHSRSAREAHRNNSTKITAANLFSKLMLHLKPFFGVIMKLQTIKKFNSKKHTAYERPTVVLNYIFPYESNSSNTLEDINKMDWGTQSSVINVISDVSSALNSSMESFNDQEIQVSEHSTVQNLIANVEPFVKKIYSGNAYSQCILRPNDVLLQSRNQNAKRIIKKSRRVAFRGHHKRFMTKAYGQNFNKMYHTFLAEVSYTNQPLQSCQNEQGVGIGSTWDINIDFGKSQDFPVQPCVEPGSDTIQKQTPDGALGLCLSKTSDLQPYQYPPGACDKNEWCKPVRISAPYGSHASTQSCKSRLRDQRTTRESAHGRKKANMKKARNIRKGRERRLAGNQIASAPAGLPCRQAMRIGSKSRFNIQLYKQTPLGAQTAIECNKGRTSGHMKQCDTTVRRKAGRTRDKKRPLKMLPCEPGICVPHKCDLSDCYRRQKGSVTETSRCCSSQVSSETRGLKRRQVTTGRENVCKEKGTSSKPERKVQLNMPNRQAVRIGSKSSFNIEYYKRMPQNALATSNKDRCDTTLPHKSARTRKKRRPLETLPCEPAICVPDKRDVSDCYRRQKSSVTETSGSCSSQVSTQTRGLKGPQLRTGKEMLCKEKGTSSKPRPKAQLNMPNRQAVRIGSKCSFNMEFYKSTPENASAMSTQDPCDTNSRRKTGRTRKKRRPLPCEPIICVPDNCDLSDCYRRQKSSVTETSGSCNSQVSTQTRGLKGRQPRTGKEMLCKEKGTSSKPRPKVQLKMPNRQAVRIGSKCSFNIEFYKSMPQNALAMCTQDPCDTTVPRKHGRTRKKERPLEMLPCEPVKCVPDKRDLSDCYRRQKSSDTESSGSCSSQVSTQTRGLKGRQLRTGKEMLCKEKGTSSKARPKAQLNMPNRQAVRIGSKCSFNMEFYKSTPENASAMSTQNSCDTTSRRKTGSTRKKRRSLPCEPVICVPDNCDLNDCYRRKKSSVTETLGSCSSQVSSQTRGLKGRQLRTGNEILCKEKGTLSKPRPKAQLNMPNRQAVRIGSKCSFNIEFYKSTPQNALAMCTQDPCDTTVPRKDGRSRKKERSLERLPCEPVKCVPDKRDLNDCYRRQKSSVTESSGSCSSQVSTQTRGLKGRQLRTGKEMLCKEKGTSSKPRPKEQLNMPNRQAVRIGSKCSFNMEFYKCMPQNASAMSTQESCDTTSRRKTGRTRKKRRPLETLPCEPGICVPDKRDVSDCYRRQKSSVTETTGSCSSQVSTQTRGLKGRQLRTGKEMLCKEKGTSSKPRSKVQLNMPNRQAVRIGSKCSFNIEFYKSMPQNALAMCIQDPCDTTVPRKDGRTKKKERPLEMLPCEPISVPDKCDPSDCYRRPKSSVTETSGSCSSQVSTQTRGLKGRQLRTGKEMLCKEKGTSSKPRPKAQLNMPNRQAVRIGSKCSFNIEFYKSMPQNALAMCTQDPCDNTVPRKAGRIRKNERPLEMLPCEPGLCVLDKCDPSDCYRRQKSSVTETSGSCSSQVSTQTRGLKGGQLRTGKEMLCKEKGTSSKPRPKAQLNMPNRQAVRIGSKCSFNIEFYKSMPQNALATCIQDPCDNTVPRKDGRTKKKERPLEMLPCEPGICVPDKCDPSDCYRRQKSSVTETSGTCSSQVSTQTRELKGRQLRPGREMLCKEIGTSSKPRPKAQINMPNRQAVRIGSKCSFNIEFYKSLPLAMREQDRSDTSGGRKGTEKTDKVLKKYQCEPGVCVPGICNPNECFQQLKTKQSTGSSKGTSQGSQTSTKIKKRQDLRAKSTFYKDKGLSSMPRFKGQLNMPNRQAVRIGSNCSFNIEFYKSSPQNALAMSGQDRGDTSGTGNDKKGKELKQYQCEPGVCAPGNCNANECFQRIKTKQSTSGQEGKGLKQYQCEPGVCVPGKCNLKECFQQIKIKHSTGTDGSLTGSSKGTSQGSQTSTKTGKKRQDLRAKTTFYKDKSLSSMPRAKRQLNMPNREAVRIGSTCSFNIEFYKSLPQSALALSASDRGDTSEKKGKGLKQYQCEPGVCTPGKCDANECFQLIKSRQSTGTDGTLTASSKGTSQGSQTSTKSGKKRQELRAKSTLYKDKGSSSMRLKKQSKVPKRKEVRIESKCSFNIEFYKSLPQNALAMRERNRGDISDGRKGTEKKSQEIKEYQCEPGVCTPGKCNANECFEQIKNKQSTGTDASLTDSSKGTSQGSQTSKKSRKNRQELRAKSTFYKDKGLSSKPRAKGKLNMPNREAVCIGSTCSFNIEFYKSLPQRALAMSDGGDTSDGRKGTRKKEEVINKYQCEPGVCEPGKCNANKCFKQIKMKQSTSGKKGKELKQYQCEPGVCVPGVGNCNANECFQIIKMKQRTGIDGSLTGSSKGTSQGSQTSTKVGKKRQELRAKSTFYKDKGSSSMRPKKQSKVPKRKAVRIGSKFSFNIEFYKSLPLSALAMSARNQGDAFDARKGTRKKEEVIKKYQCEPGVCEPGKCNANKCFKQIKMKQNTSGKKGIGLKQYQCEPGVCAPGNCNANECFKQIKMKQNTSGKKGIGLKQYQCELGVCAPGNCNANECFQRIKTKQSTSGKKGKGLKQYQCEPGVCVPGNCNANECFQLIKTKQSTDGSLTGNSKGTTSQGSQISAKAQKTRQELKSKSTFFKEKGSSSIPRPKASLNMPNRKAVRIGSTCSFNIEFYKSFPRNGSEMSEQAGTGKKGQALQKYQCEPGVCVPSKCNPNECFQVLKTNYEASGFGSSLTGSSRGSQANNYRYKNKTQVLKSGNVTLYKDKGVASKRHAKKLSHKEITKNRQPLHIGSECSLNVEFYKSWSQNSQAMRSMNEQADTRKKSKALSKYQCKPGLCVAGECNAKQCFKQLKTENGTSDFDSSQTGSSLGSWITTKIRKKKIKSSTDGKPNRQAVRIGSMCSFNIDLYVGRRPQDTLVTNQQSSLNVPKKRQKSLPGKIKPRKKNKRIFECKPNVCIPGKCNPVECLKQFECKPRVCVPGKCDPSDCIKRMSGSDESFTGSSMSTQSRKLKSRMPRECDKTVYKEKGVSCIPVKPSLRSGNHQGVRIGSSCSFNIEFYKEMSHPEQKNQGDTGKKSRVSKKYECMPGICKPGKCNAVECYNRLKNSQSSTSGGKKSRKIRKVSNKYECEPGVCIPGKCNAKECFQIFKAKHNIDTDGSFTDSSLAASRASQVSKKRKRKQPGLRSGKATFLTERGASTMPRSKMLLHLQNRQAVRIGSTCSFNIEFYKAVPGYKRPRDANVRPIRPPFQYNIDQTKQYPPQYYPSSSETSRDSTSTSLSDKKGKISGKKEKVPGKKEKVSGMKEKISGVKEKISRKKEKISKKKEKLSVEKEKISGKTEKIPEKKEKTPGKKEKIPGKKEKISVKKEKSKAKQDQGDTTLQKKSSSDNQVKKKEPKRKTTKEKPSSRKTEQGDVTSKQKLATEKKVKPKEIRTKRKQSQTRVRDQQSDTQVNEKVGTGKLQSQGDTPVQRKETKKIGKPLTEKQKGKYDEGDKGFEKGNVSTSTVASPPSSDSVSVSKKTSVNLDRKKEAERRKAEASTLPVYKDMGISHIAADKKGEVIQQRIPPLATPGSKKQVCRIGSSCSFNFQLYKDKPLSPDQAASLRSASPSTPEVKTEKNNMANYIRKCMCKFTGQRSIPCPNISGTASQTKQKFECVSGSCDYAKCEKNQCPARFNIDTGIGTDTCGRGKPPVACCTNAATQSRRCPGLQQLLRDPRAATRLRNAPYPSIVPGNWPFGPIPGYGDNFNGCIVREQAVILGSGCGFNVNFFKKRNKRKK